MKECSKCRNCYEDDIETCPLDSNTPVFTIAGSTTISGRYILEGRLGQGGMGIVFRAKHKFLKSSHAIKIILPSLVDGDENLLVRFRQEAILAASIDHPNVIRVTDFGVENDIMPFLVMEFVDGIPLSNYLKEGKPLTLKEAFELFIPVADGVAEAHRKGIVHRDLKPQNIMVQKNLPLKKAVKVLDFGLAKIKSADSYPSLIQAKTMNIVGSPPYMSPEQWSGDGVDHRTDIYALAVILYQMVTGQLPFQADTMPSMMYQHLTATPPSAASHGVTLIPGIEAAIHKGLEKEPQNRYDSMDEMLVDLEHALAYQEKQGLMGTATEYMIPRPTADGKIPKPSESVPTLSESQKERFYSYFDSKQKPELIADNQLAQDFLEAQDRIESAKTVAVHADLLVQELVEAQKEAAQAQDKALQAKQRIEADVRRQVEAEMERLAVEDQAKHEAKAKQLAEEIEARRVAEERANYMAQAALEAQQLAENERLKGQEEAQKRVFHEGGRREAEIESQRLAQQVAEARKQYEDAKNEAAREAQFRAEAEVKQKQIESELQAVASNEAERRKLVEAKAKKEIEEQAEVFEKEAAAAKQRLEEASLLAELEAKKREQAEAARIHAEEEAQRLSKEIIEVQREMEELRQHITSSDGAGISYGSNPNMLSRDTGSSVISLTHQGSGQMSRQIPSSLLNTGQISNRKTMIGIAAGVICLILFAGGGLGIFLFVKNAGSNGKNVNIGAGDNLDPNGAPAPVERTSILIEGGSFMIGRSDIENKNDPDWGNEFPAHAETVPTFSIDANETTVEQYAKFVKDTGYKAPSYWKNGEPPVREGNYPVTNVSLIDAKAYADWISKIENRTCRLPTEIEWEFAARNGSKNNSLPWGDEWQRDFAVLEGRAVAVGTSRDETLTGVKDMLGNVAEWTSSKYALYNGHPGKLAKADMEKFVVRGLSYDIPKGILVKPERLLAYRQYATETQDASFIGFRLVCGH